ncbi:helix-turn-helix transcriptional regulator [Mucilaginibacter pedocola]|uniref:Plasmid maintenance system antidote protein n=1 Tax=Mucilaginibacter pedocola TaxID=1792845 RepID=A0A1S9PB71_9SPHI|nr:plasmid maintenance system antidote protein [Mucilaginibacter pedocola]OOQ58226.1 plasmid maintenance system antidote protein [Mucilaginibacter pedocola]
MTGLIEKYKGIHPGLILERELKKRKMRKGPFALSLQEYPQTLTEITKGRRGLTPALSLKIDEALGLQEGTMLVLQAYYEIKREKEKTASSNHPDLTILRRILFWDTAIEKIDWHKHQRAVIKRVFERGNEEERAEIIRFYGEEGVAAVIGNAENKRIPIMNHLAK